MVKNQKQSTNEVENNSVKVNKQCYTVFENTNLETDFKTVSSEQKLINKEQANLNNGVELIAVDRKISAEIPPNTNIQELTLIHGNNEEILPINAVMTRNQARKLDEAKSPNLLLQIPDISPDKFKDIQKSDKSLDRFWKAAQGKSTQDEGLKATFLIKKGLLYRKPVKPRGLGECRDTQLVIPSELRHIVLRTAHESVLGCHMGTKKTSQRIQANFWFDGIVGYTHRYCRSCDVCQRTIKHGTIKKAPMLISKLSDMPFTRISCDLVGPIIPTSTNGHSYILTIIDLATRYPEAIPMKRITTTKVADALKDFFFRMGIPDVISTDNGPQFCSNEMEEFFRMFNIQHIRSTPYHAMSQGVIERFHGSLKKCLMRLCAEKTKNWDSFVGPCLYALRETVNNSTGFSPNECVFGRTLKSSGEILRKLLTNDQVQPEVKTTYQHVLDLRNRIQETCELVKSELANSQQKNKIQFDKKTKHRTFTVGSLVLLMRPVMQNALQYKWDGPFTVTKVIGLYDYEIKLKEGKHKIYHINMLKEYFPRDTMMDEQIEPVISCSVATVVEEEDNPELAVTDEEIMIHYNTKQKESYLNVKYSENISQARLKELKSLVFQFKEIFSDVPTITNLDEHKIDLTDDRPIRCKPYPVPLHLEDALNKEIDSMLNAGIIEPSEDYYASPLVLVKKPDGSIRVCVNYKALNAKTLVSPYPMLSTDDIMDKLGGSKFYSKFDLCKGYYQIPLEENSRKYSTLICKRGLYRFTVLPMGLVSAGATFTRMMRKLLNGTENLDSYLDDVLCHTKTWEEHISSLRVFFTRVQDANLRLKPSKCELGGNSVSFLGHKVTEDQRSPDNLNKMMEANRPQNKKQVMAYLGMAQFHSSYIPHYSTIVSPLTNLLKKNMPDKIVWGDDQERSFQTIKSHLLSEPVLKLPDLGKPFVIRTDASDVGMAACILQEYDSILFPVVFASKKFCPAETRYTISERECLAVVWGINKFKKYLMGAKFTLETDHAPLSILKTSNTSSPRLQRWCLSLQCFDFTVKYIKGDTCLWSDFLSRNLM